MQNRIKGRSKGLKIGIVIAIVIIFILGLRYIYSSIHANHTELLLSDLSSDTTTLSCAVFDGKEVWDNSTVLLKDGMITEETSLNKGATDSEYFLMPRLIDAHAHLTTPYQMELMVKNGVITVCDVSASEELQNSYDALNVWSSRTSIWLDVDNADTFVRNTIG